eukprot:2554951-Pleurochrysis_carterae.AAC.6
MPRSCEARTAASDSETKEPRVDARSFRLRGRMSRGGRANRGLLRRRHRWRQRLDSKSNESVAMIWSIRVPMQVATGESQVA